MPIDDRDRSSLHKTQGASARSNPEFGIETIQLDELEQALNMEHLSP
jgi:hypothetical protein